MDNRLPKSIDIRTYTRPIKIAFLVPDDNSLETNLILDAVFHDSYTRWGGAHSLIIDCSEKTSICDSSISWINFYDPDLIYAYVRVQDKDIQLLNSLCPMGMISHKHRANDSAHWREYIPDYGQIKPILSVSTLYEPRRGLTNDRSDFSTHLCLTQFKEISDNRFLPDNFGVAHHNRNYTNPVSGVYDTISYCEEGIPENNKIATTRCFSESAVLEQISSGKISTFSLLSSASASGTYHPAHPEWNTAFNLFIGNSASDRVCFWNSRLISSPNSNVNESAILVSPEYFSDELFVAELGRYLNKTNFKHEGNGASRVSVRSQSIDRATCVEFAKKVQAGTWNAISVSDRYNIKPEFQPVYFGQERGLSNPSFKTQERKIKFLANEPEHFRFLPPRYLEARDGQWIVDFDIERHQGDEKYSNILNDWRLPRRQELVTAFTSAPGKITKHGTLAVLAMDHDSLAPLRKKKNNPQISIYFPDDELIFRRLIEDIPSLIPEDMRKILKHQKYAAIELSDKGLNHRGIVAKFRNAIEAAEILANSFWRKILRDCINKPNKKYSINQLTALIQKITSAELRKIGDRSAVELKNTKKYLLSSLSDTIEYLIHIGVMQQLYVWKCKYCGNDNKRNVNTLKLNNDCDVCQDQHLYPVDAEWSYRIAPFIVESLAERNGLTVLLAIAHLLDNSERQQSFYLPEVNLYDNFEDRNCTNEIDLIAVIDGSFCIVEVKRSAASFVDTPQEIEGFISECNKIQPDIAILFFEQYCETQSDEKIYKVRLSETAAIISEKLPAGTELKIITASDLESYHELPFCSGVGICGDRANSFLFTNREA